MHTFNGSNWAEDLFGLVISLKILKRYYTHMTDLNLDNVGALNRSAGNRLSTVSGNKNPIHTNLFLLDFEQNLFMRAY